MKTYIWEWVCMCSTTQAFPCPSSTCRIQRPPYRLSEVAELVTPKQYHPLWAWAIQLTGPIHPGSSHELTESTFLDSDSFHKQDLKISQNARPWDQSFKNVKITPSHRQTATWPLLIHTCMRPHQSDSCPQVSTSERYTTMFPHFLSLQGSAVVMVRAIGFQKPYFQGTKHSKSYSGYSSTFINFYLYCK